MERTAKVHRALAAATVAWLAWGILGFWPLALVECDGPVVAVAADAMRAGWPTASAIAYNQEGTPGSYAVLAAASRWTGVASWPLFAVLTGLAAVVFLLGGTRMLARETQTPWPVAALVLLSFQEMLAAGSYPNTNAMAAGLLGAALLFAWAQARWWSVVLAAVLFGLAGCVRADVALEALVFPVLLWGPRPRGRNVARVLAFAGISAGTALAGIYACGSSIPRILGKVHAVLGPPLAIAPGLVNRLLSPAFINHIAFLLVAHVLVLGLGLVLLVRRRRWRLLLLTATGVVPLWYVYGPTLPTPKEIHYLIPFLALPVMEAVVWLATRFRAGQRWPAVAVATIAALQLLVGVRFVLSSKPWAAEPGPTFAVAWDRTLPPGKPISRLAVVLGAGIVLPSPDGPRLGAGVFWAPLMWREQKRLRAGVTDDLRRMLAELPAGTQTLAWTNTCDGDASSRLALAQAGYQCTFFGPADGARRMTWRQGDREVRVVQIDFSDYSLSHFAKWRGRRGLYLYGSGREARRLQEQAPGAKLLTGFEDITPLGAFDLTMPDVPTPSSL